MVTASKQSYQSLELDLSKLPEQVRVVGKTALTLILRAGFDLALSLARGRHATAIEVVHEALYRLVDPDKYPIEGDVRAHFLRLVRSSYTELRHGSRAERAACAVYAHEQGRSSRSPEDIAIAAEEQGDLDIEDADRTTLAEAVRARLAGHELASAIIAVWENEGDVAPRALAHRLGASPRAVYSAIELIRYHARHARKDCRRRKKGEAS